MFEAFRTGIAIEIDPTGARSGAGEVNRALDSVKAHARRFTHETRNEFNLLKDNLFDVKSVVASVFAGAAVYGGSALAQQFAAADRGFRDIKSLGVPQTLREIREEVGLTARAFGVDLADATKSYYDAISAGVRPDAVRPFVDTAAMLKDVAQGDMPTALDILTSAVNAYGKSVEDVDDIADQLALTVNKGKITLSQMGLLGGVMTTAATNKVPLEEILAATAIATAKGVVPEQALTGLGQAIGDISSPTEEARRAAKALNLEWGQAAVHSKGLVGLLNEISSAYDRMAPGLDHVIRREEQRQASLKNRTTEDEKYLRFLQDVRVTGQAGVINALFPSREAQRPITAIAGENIGELNRTLLDLQQTSGNMQKTWNELFKDAPSTELARFKTEWDELKIAMGEILTKAALPLLQEFLVPGIRTVRDFTRENETLVQVVTGLGVTLGAVYAGGALIKSIQVLDSFIGITRLAVSTLNAMRTAEVAATAARAAAIAPIALTTSALEAELAMYTATAAARQADIVSMQAAGFSTAALSAQQKATLAATAATQAAIATANANTAALTATSAATTTAATATRGLWAVISAHPIGLTVTALAGLGMAIYAYRREIDELLNPLEKEKRLIQEANDLSRQRISHIAELSERYESLATKANRTLTEEIELKNVTQELKEIFPDLALGVNSAADAITNLANAVDQAKLGESIKSLTGDMVLGIRELESLQKQANAVSAIAHRGGGPLFDNIDVFKPDPQKFQSNLQKLMAAGEQRADYLFALQHGMTREQYQDLKKQTDSMAQGDLFNTLLSGGKGADPSRQIATWLAGREIKLADIWGGIEVDPSRFDPKKVADHKERDPFKERVQSLALEIETNRALFKVQGEGASAIDAVTASMRAQQDVASMDIANGTERAAKLQILTRLYADQISSERALQAAQQETQRQAQRQQAVDERIQSMAYERDETLRLLEAQRQGDDAVRAATDRIEAERIARELSIDAKHKDYQTLMDLIGVMQKARGEIERLSDAQEQVRQLNENYMPPELRYRQDVQIVQDAAVTGGLLPGVEEAALKRASDTFREEQRRILADSRDLRDGMELAFWDIRDISDNAAAQVYDAWTGTYRGMTDELTRMLQTGEISIKGFLTVLQGAAAQFASEQIMGSVFNFLGKAFGVAGAVSAPVPSVPGSIPSFGDYGGIDLNAMDFIPREKGGPVSERSLYLIGERGPELFSPGQSGTVYPNSMLSLLEKNLSLPRMDSQPMPAAAAAPPSVSNRSVTLNGGIHLSFKLDGNKPISKQAAFETRRAVGAELAALLEEGGRDR